MKTCPTCRQHINAGEIIEIQLNNEESQIQANVDAIYNKHDELTKIYLDNKAKLEAAYRELEEKSKLKRKAKTAAVPNPVSAEVNIFDYSLGPPAEERAKTAAVSEAIEISDDSPPPEKKAKKQRFIIVSSDDE